MTSLVSNRLAYSVTVTHDHHVTVNRPTNVSAPVQSRCVVNAVASSAITNTYARSKNSSRREALRSPLVRSCGGRISGALRSSVVRASSWPMSVARPSRPAVGVAGSVQPGLHRRRSELARDVSVEEAHRDVDRRLVSEACDQTHGRPLGATDQAVQIPLEREAKPARYRRSVLPHATVTRRLRRD